MSKMGFSLPKYLLLVIPFPGETSEMKLPQPRTYQSFQAVDKAENRWIARYPDALIVTMMYSTSGTPGYYVQRVQTDRYYRQIKETWDWDNMLASIDDVEFSEETDDGDAIEGREYLGSVLSLAPSGKYYTPWANSNVDITEATLDQVYYDALDAVAEEHGGSIESGEGDPLDIYFCKRFPIDAPVTE